MLRNLAAPVLCVLALVVPVGGCKRAPAAPAPPPNRPTLRVHIVSTAAGALEPCGCVKDMLGGIDHAAAVTASGREAATGTLLVGAGPTFFMDPELAERFRTQAIWKAEAIADSFKDMGLAAWTPGANDWAAGAKELARLRARSGAALLAANLSGDTAGAQSTRVVEVQSLRVGIAGVSTPVDAGALPAGVEVADAERALGQALQQLETEKAQVRIALLALDRGQAMRLAERVNGFQLMVVGKPFDRGEVNDAPTPPAIVGETLVVQAPNHLQAIAVVDLYTRGDDFKFRDGSGLADAERRASLQRRIADLKARIGVAQQPDSGVQAADLAARREDLGELEAELGKMPAPQAPAEGSFFRYQLIEVRESAGSEAAVAARLRTYYRRVNEHNRVALADRKPMSVAPEGRGYIGVKKCQGCHEEETKFWRTTEHAGAYEVLAREDKQFNLDCVGCHVTGYDKPGGSTVTHVDGLKDNQCENCHGPGSLHAESPTKKGLIDASPVRSLCASECHHPPHVQPNWNVDEAWKKIIGPGHGG